MKILMLAGSMLCAGVVARAQSASTAQSPAHPAIVSSELIYNTPLVGASSVHASTIIETPKGLVAAWFGGSRESAPDVGIWVSRKEKTWSKPVRVATGLIDGKRYATWNPVLFESAPGELTLFYKVGPSPAAWWGMKRTSKDGGVTWSNAVKLPKGVLGPIKNKPVRVTNAVLAPSSTESPATPSRWRVHFERSTDQGTTWTTIAPPMDSTLDAIQPTILTYRGGWLQALMRTQSGRIYETWSPNNGLDWSGVAPTSLPNPNSGIDAVTLNDRRQLLVYNNSSKDRTPLSVAVSSNGIHWSAPVAIETAAGEYSYPAVIQTADSLVHITYTWKRTRIKHVVIDPRRIRSPRNDKLDSVLATMLPKLAPLAASRDSLALMLIRDSATSRADSAVWRYRESAGELMKVATTSFDDSTIQHMIYPGDSAVRARLRNPAQRFVPPDLAVADSLYRFLDARGVFPFRDEGATYYNLSEGVMLSRFGPYVREGMRAYMRLEALEQRSPSLEDAEFRISLEDVADRLVVADSVADRFRGTIAWQQIDWRRAAYLSLLVNGTDASPAFDANTHEMSTEFKAALERMANRRGVAISGRVVRDYLALLRANGFKDVPAVTEFRQKVRESAGPRG